MDKIKGIFIDVENNTIKEKGVDSELNSYRKMLKCDLIDIVTRPVGGKNFTFIIDDNGLLKNNCIPACVSDRGVEIVGNTFICNSIDTSEGCIEASLNDDEINHILNNTALVQIEDDLRKVIYIS